MTSVGSIFKLGALLALVGITGATWSFDEKVVSVCNTTGLTVSDLHVTFSGSGGNVSVAPASVFAGPCPVPAVPSNGTVTNTVNINWGTPCVPPLAWVTFTVRTVNGPLNLVSGNWTLGGVPVGAIGGGHVIIINPPPPPPPPPRPFWAKKWQTKCIPNGRILRTPWMGLPGTPCWVRWICIPSYTQYSRKARCLYISRNGRLIETARCIAITKWKKTGFQPARYRWQRTTLRPPDLNDPGNIPPIGPPKNTPKGGWEWGTNLPQQLFVRYSDDSGDTERLGDDMISSFFDVYHQLVLEDLGTPEFPTFSSVLQAIGPGWRRGGQRIQALIPEFNTVLAAEPTGSVNAIRVPLTNVGNMLVAIGTDMQDGTVNTPTAFFQLETALTQLATNMPALDPADQRWMHAQSVIFRMRDGIHVSAQQAALGLVNQTQQDYFLWGLQNRFAPEMHSLAYAVSPHIEFDLNLGMYGWEPSELEGVRVLVLNPLNGEILDQSTLPISSNGKVFVPTIGYEELSQVDIRLKFDTFLGARYLVPTDLPSPISVPLINGDVNGDEIIDGQDVLAVTSTLGQGGPTAEFVPPSDLNDDGIVDTQDLNLVNANLGQMGNAFFEMTGNVGLQDYVGLVENEEIALTFSDASHPSRTVLLSNTGEYSVAMPDPGLFALNFKGRTWLSQTQSAFFGPGSEPFILFSLMNGDVDGDNEVGPGDFGLLSSSFGSVPGDANFNFSADLDGDGEVGPSDFGILSSNFGESGT